MCTETDMAKYEIQTLGIVNMELRWNIQLRQIPRGRSATCWSEAEIPIPRGNLQPETLKEAA